MADDRAVAAANITNNNDTSNNNTDDESVEYKELDWDGPDDPENPHNWPFMSKVYASIIPVISVLVVSIFISIYVPGAPQIQYKYRVSQTVSLLPLSLAVIGIGLGPMIGAPISESAGRIAVYRFSIVLFALFTFGCALSNNLATLIICRFLAAMFGSPAVAVGAGSVSDVWDLEESAGTAGNIFLMMALLGPALGPLIGGFIAENKSWRWLMWANLILTAPVFLSLIPARETYKNIILRRRAIKRGIRVPPKPTIKEELRNLFVVTLKRPVHMMLTEPLVIFTAIYTAFVFALLFLYFEAIPYVMLRVYQFKLGEIGACFSAVAIGILLAGITFYICDRLFYQPSRARGKTPVPEKRLYSAMAGSILLVTSLFWFAWLAKPEYHWAVPLVGVVLFGWGMFAIYVASVAYMLDVYDAMVSASALAANSMCRYVLGAAFPLFAVKMYDRLGREWAGSLLAFIAVGMMPLPWVMYKWGAGMRARSAYIKHECK